MSDAKLSSNELVAELLEVAKQVVRECESCYGKGERKHTFTGQMIACSKCADAKKAIARASSEQKSGKCADEASRDLRAPMPKGSLPNSLGNEHLYEPDQEWMNAPLGEHSAHEPCNELPDETPTTDDLLRNCWRAAGGKFHGPNVETGTMPEAKLLSYLRHLYQQIFDLRTAQPPLPEQPQPIATVINNNQPGWTNIVETAPNVTLSVGTKLYDESALIAVGVRVADEILEREPDVPPPRASQLAWLIERQQKGRAVWYASNFEWTTDANAAMWFVRKEDAKGFCRNTEIGASAVEHMFCSQPASIDDASPTKGAES